MKYVFVINPIAGNDDKQKIFSRIKSTFRLIDDEMIIEALKEMSLDVVCQQMARTPKWAEGLILRADGYECEFYKKD